MGLFFTTLGEKADLVAARIADIFPYVEVDSDGVIELEGGGLGVLLRLPLRSAAALDRALQTVGSLVETLTLSEGEAVNLSLYRRTLVSRWDGDEAPLAASHTLLSITLRNKHAASPAGFLSLRSLFSGASAPRSEAVGLRERILSLRQEIKKTLLKATIASKDVTGRGAVAETIRLFWLASAAGEATGDLVPEPQIERPLKDLILDGVEIEPMVGSWIENRSHFRFIAERRSEKKIDSFPCLEALGLTVVSFEKTGEKPEEMRSMAAFVDASHVEDVYGGSLGTYLEARRTTDHTLELLRRLDALEEHAQWVPSHAGWLSTFCALPPATIDLQSEAGLFTLTASDTGFVAKEEPHG